MKITKFKVNIIDKKGKSVNNFGEDQEEILIIHDGKFKVGDQITILK